MEDNLDDWLKLCIEKIVLPRFRITCVLLYELDVLGYGGSQDCYEVRTRRQ